jgi:16S rRNA (cytosine1402-N4)-methyltransferase
MIELLAPAPGAHLIDATFGAGGYARRLLDVPATRLLAIDRDPAAIAAGAALAAEYPGRLVLAQGRFSELDAIAARHGFTAADGVVLDIGVSSMQLDDPARGVAFRMEGPLDMRMEPVGPSAADVVAQATERDLAAVIALLGEEHRARAVARAIVRARQAAPIRTTAALAAIIAGAVRTRAGDIHPATRTFQALRILVNDELRELARALCAAERILRPGGRLVVVSFHSLEDRIVKTFLAARSRAPAGSRHRPERPQPPPSFLALTRRPVTPSATEIAANPRARSARLRAAERTPAPPHAPDIEAMLPPVPPLAQILRGGR